MKKRSLLMILMVAVLALSAAACGSKKEVSLGAVENNRYQNDYFGLRVDIPKDWKVADAKAFEQVTNAGKDVIAGDDSKMKKQLDLAEERVLNLLLTSKLPLNQSDALNPNVVCTAEKLSFLQNVKDGEGYLKSSQKLMKNANLPYEFGDITTEKVGGKEFSVMPAKLDAGNGIVVSQKYYSRVMDGYALNFIQTYFDDATKAEVDQVLKSVTLE